MTAMRIVVNALSDGIPRTTQELMAVTGMTKRQISSATAGLKAKGQLASVPVTYQLVEGEFPDRRLKKQPEAVNA